MISNRHYFMSFLMMLLIGLVTNVASAETCRPNHQKGPTEVTVDIFLLDLDAIDSANQNFQANVYIEASWRDPRLADESRNSIVTRKMDEVWHPRLQILNQQRLWSSLPDVVEIEPDGRVIQRFRVWGDFSQPLDLHDFPFDKQRIELPIVAAGYNSDEVVFLAGAGSGIGKTLSIADWQLRDWKIATDFDVPGPSLAAKGAGMAMVIDVNRYRGYYWIKVIAPLILIVAMSLAVHWIDPKDTGTKISITITAMLTLIAYRFAIGASLPQVSYLTRMDLFILFSTILVYASLVTVIITAAYSRKGKSEAATRIDQVSRWAFPLFFITSWFVSMNV
jgi:hypothetical protein